MPYTPKFLGSAVETTAGNDIVIPDCITVSGDNLVIVAGAHDAPGEPTVSYGGVNIIGDDWRIAPASRLSGGIWMKNSIWNGRTAAVTVSFGSSIDDSGTFIIGNAYKIVVVGTTDFTLIGAASNTVGIIFTATGVGAGDGTARTQLLRRWCMVYATANAGRKDLIKRNVQDTATTDPSTLLSATLGTANELMIAYHLNNGPITDTAGSMGAGLTALHRIGSSTGIDDITIQTTMQETSVTDPIKSNMTGATSRQWLSALIAVRPDTFNNQGLVPGEFYQVEAKFQSLGLDFNNAVFHYNTLNDYWEVFHIDTSALTAITNSSLSWE